MDDKDTVEVCVSYLHEDTHDIGVKAAKVFCTYANSKMKGDEKTVGDLKDRGLLSVVTFASETLVSLFLEFAMLCRVDVDTVLDKELFGKFAEQVRRSMIAQFKHIELVADKPDGAAALKSVEEADNLLAAILKAAKATKH